MLNVLYQRFGGSQRWLAFDRICLRSDCMLHDSMSYCKPRHMTVPPSSLPFFPINSFLNFEAISVGEIKFQQRRVKRIAIHRHNEWDVRLSLKTNAVAADPEIRISPLTDRFYYKQLGCMLSRK